LLCSFGRGTGRQIEIDDNVEGNVNRLHVLHAGPESPLLDRFRRFQGRTLNRPGIGLEFDNSGVVPRSSLVHQILALVLLP